MADEMMQGAPVHIWFHLCDLATLMIATYECYSVWISHLHVRTFLHENLL